MKALLAPLALFLTLNASSLAEPVNGVRHVPTDEPMVALTFDDGPNGENMKAILKILEEQDAKATFFLVGKNVKKEPELARLTLEQGHELANHTMTHPHLTKLPAEEVLAQIVDTQAAIEAATGFTPVLFRAPYIEVNDEVLAIVAEQNLPEIRANRSVGDWQSDITEEKIIQRAVNGVKPGDIILMHSWSDKTKNALPAILESLKAKGLRSVTVSELLAAKKDDA